METEAYDSGRPKTIIEPSANNTQRIQVQIAEYALDKGVYQLGTVYMQGNFQSKEVTFKKAMVSEIDYKAGKYYIYNEQTNQYTISNGLYNKDTQYYKRECWYYLTSEDGNIVKSLVSKSYTDLINARIGIFFNTPLDKEVYFENV
jgi:hypothetical protein